MSRARWTDPILYDAAELWVDRCLREEGSLFTPGRAIWTAVSAGELQARVGAEDFRDLTFMEKLLEQINGVSPEATQLTAELLYVVLLPEHDTGAPKKLEHINVVLAQLPDASLPDNLAGALGTGIANYGQVKNRRDAFLRFFIAFLLRWTAVPLEQRYQLLDDPWEFRGLIEETPKHSGAPQAEALLNLVFPDTFEPIISPDAKRKIAKRFEQALPATANQENVDRELAELRGAIEPILGAEFTYYDEPLRRVWSTASKTWDEFVDWAARIFGAADFDRTERDYKLEIAERVEALKAAIDGGDVDWLDRLDRVFEKPNNLIDWRASQPFKKWCEEQPDAVAALLRRLWSSPEIDIDDLVDVLKEWPSFNRPGNQLAFTSLFLMATDATRYPIFRPTPYRRALKLVGADEASHGLIEIEDSVTYRPEELANSLNVTGLKIRTYLRQRYPRDSAERGADWQLTAEQAREVVDHFASDQDLPERTAARYFRYLDLLDELRLRLLARGVELRDRLDAQSLVWWITRREPPEEWTSADKSAFEEYRAKAGTAVTSKNEVEGAETSLGSERKKAWLIRGANSGGENLIPEWLAEGFVSIGWVEAGEIDPSASREEINRVLQEAYPDYSAGTLANSVGNLVRFLRQIEPGDLVLTIDGPNLWAGRITGSPTWAGGAQGGKARRRPVDWLNTSAPFLRSEVKLSAPTLYSRLRTLLTVTDLKEDVETLAALLGLGPPAEHQDAEVPPASAALAKKLFVTESWLNEIVDLLNDKGQVVFYGPPGTGKTYIAQALGEQIENAGGESRLVQFHPSYAYEDFFEGFRPASVAGGAISFQLTPGPLRLIADEARQNPTKPYLLIVDEINRGNIAKIFGELYFLLEYRDQPVTLQYSPQEEFTLPRNLFFIGTMNTADRSIALVDSALRRRFYFVPFLPTEQPLRDVLRLWLESKHLDIEPATLLQRLNEAIGATEFSIGPAYFMDAPGTDGVVNLERIWRYSIRPLLEEHYYGTGRNTDEFSFESLRRQGTEPLLEDFVDDDADER